MLLSRPPRSVGVAQFPGDQLRVAQVARHECAVAQCTDVAAPADKFAIARQQRVQIRMLGLHRDIRTIARSERLPAGGPRQRLAGCGTSALVRAGQGRASRGACRLLRCSRRRDRQAASAASARRYASVADFRAETATAGDGTTATTQIPQQGGDELCTDVQFANHGITHRLSLTRSPTESFQDRGRISRHAQEVALQADPVACLADHLVKGAGQQ